MNAHPEDRYLRGTLATAYEYTARPRVPDVSAYHGGPGNRRAGSRRFSDEPNLPGQHQRATAKRRQAKAGRRAARRK